MARVIEKSDRKLLDALCRQGAMTVEQLGKALNVTATAIRQRLERLTAAGAVDRQEIRKGRGRPSFQYELTEAGRETLGHNMADLARVLWSEIRQIENDTARTQLLHRITKRLSDLYALEVAGDSIEDRLESLANCLRARDVVVSVEKQPEGQLPILKINGCPYPGLSGPDHHDICDVEQSMFSDVLGHPLRLTECRCHSAEGSCTFVLSANAATS